MSGTTHSLVEGYRLTEPVTITPPEVGNLFRQVEIGRYVTDDYLTDRHNPLSTQEGGGFLDVGVRDADDELVGFGSVAHNGHAGMLGDFVVSPAHQGRGIGKAIISERLRLAEEVGVTTLSIPNLEPTNTLRTYYLRHGFIPTASGLLVRAVVKPPRST